MKKNMFLSINKLPNNLPAAGKPDPKLLRLYKKVLADSSAR